MKAKRIIAYTALGIGLLLFVSVEVAGANPGEEPQETPPRFGCSPQRLKEGDTLLIQMSTPHGRDLAVVDPQKRFRFVVFWRPATSFPAPLVDWETFEGMSALRLSIANLQAPAVDTRGWHAPSRVFTKRGRYRILLADNLETEEEGRGDVRSCEVFFEGPARHE